MVHSDSGRSIDRRAPGSSRSSGRGAVLGLLSATGMLVGLVAAGWSAEIDGPRDAEGIAYTGRLTESGTNQPVEGVDVILERSIRGAARSSVPAWVGESKVRTDAEGRFRLDFPPDQVAERRLHIALRIRHPGFIPRKSSKVALADLIRGQARGDERFFTKITLGRGVEYTAQVAVPGGRPAAGIPYAFENAAMRASLPRPVLQDDYEGQTDDEGRIRIRMPKTHALALYVGPPRTSRARLPVAPYQHFWGTDSAAGQPGVWAPTDLGRIVLSRGIRLSGRLVDSADRPIAGQTIIAYPLKGRDRHSTTTEADGTFALGPLRPANYLIYGEGQSPYFDWDLDAAAHARAIRVVRPARVYLKEGASPEPLVLREMPTVRVELRFVDSKGKPTLGSTTMLWGLLPEYTHPPRRFPVPAYLKRQGLTSAVNAPEREDPWEPSAWGAQGQSDADGRVVFSAPQGLLDASVSVLPEEEATAFKHRIDPNGPILPMPPARLGVVEGDRQLTIIAYRAPTVLVSVKTEDGAVPEELSVMARYTIDPQSYVSQFVRQPDGRFRSQRLMPDHEYAITVRDPRGVYDLAPVQRISVPESGAAESSFLLRKRRPPPGVGQPAPPFAVKTIEGRALSLASLRGKMVLLHFWQPVRGVPDAASFRAIHDRFGSDERFAMIGLYLFDDSEAATSVIHSAGLSWPQALLRDGWYDPIVTAYKALQPDVTFLIDHDGKLIARGLRGAALEKAVAAALAGK